jgi:hypothetical protein
VYDLCASELLADLFCELFVAGYGVFAGVVLSAVGARLNVRGSTCCFWNHCERQLAWKMCLQYAILMGSSG